MRNLIVILFFYLTLKIKGVKFNSARKRRVTLVPVTLRRKDRYLAIQKTRDPFTIK